MNQIELKIRKIVARAYAPDNNIFMFAVIVHISLSI